MTDQSCLLRAEPSFHAPATKLDALTGSHLLSWLTERGSLTRRLRVLAGAEFRVEVLREQWAKPFPGEARLLALRAARSARVREVVLLAGDTPLVLARSIIPHRTLCGRHSPLARLGTRPLGDWLFSHPSMRRLSLEITHVKPELWCSDIDAWCRIDAPLWGRRSHYRVARHPLLVCEFFLPQLLNLEHRVISQAAV